MGGHLLAGMLAPLLLVLSAPVTLALRTLDVVPARRLSRLLRSRPARVVAHPITAAALSAGGMWVLYTTPLFEAMQTNPLLHLLVHAHFLAAGYLFTAAMIGIDPRPHPPTRQLLAVVLVLALASHSILAKYLYAHPPAGVAALDAQQGAELMYYLGAWIEAAIIMIFCAEWYRAAGRRLAAASAVRGRRATPDSSRGAEA
jgi:putative membrane protein